MALVDVDRSTIYIGGLSPSRLAWSGVGGRSPALSLHLSNEPGELWQWLWS